MAIRAITFDLDDTLFDFRACMARGADAVLAELRRRHPSAEAADRNLFDHLWDEATREASAADGVPDWPAIRRRGIELLLARCGCGADDAACDALTALY